MHNQLDTQIAAFKQHFSGRLIQPQDPDYDEFRALWNGMIDRRPRLIALCQHTQDVIAAVNFARESGLPVSVRGGGHNVAGSAVVDDGLVIDLREMKRIEVNPEQRTARAEPGVTWGELDRATQAHNLVTPGGVVSDTGIAGLTLGGGYGWLRRKYGLSCDNLIAAEVVTSDGRLLRTSETENPDLLWALRGGGGMFGVVTAFEYRLHPFGPEAMFVAAFHDGDHALDVMRFFREYCASSPDEVSAFAVLGRFPQSDLFPAEVIGRQFALLMGMYAGDIEEGRRVLQPLREVTQPLVDFSGVQDYVDEIQTFFDEDYPSGEMHYYWKSLYLNELSDDALRRMIDITFAAPSDHTTLDVWHLGGAIERVSPQESAFGNRHAPYMLGIEANWEHAADDEANIAWARRLSSAMQPFSDGSEYLNFPGFHEYGETSKLFGVHTQRLEALKRQYDPANLFSLRPRQPTG